MTHTLIYPHTSRHNAAGHLEIGGCDVVELADTFGTPLFIYDEQTLRDQCRAYVAAFAARTRRSPRSSTRARPSRCRAMMRARGRRRACRSTSPPAASSPPPAPAGFPPARIFFHGNNKSAAEIEARRSTTASATSSSTRSHEIERARARPPAGAASRQQRARAPHAGRAARHPRSVQTGQPDSKFGFGLADGLADEARAPPARAPLTSSSSACTPTSARRSSTCRRTGARSRSSSARSPSGAATSASTAACSTSAAASASATPRRDSPRRSPSSPTSRVDAVAPRPQRHEHAAAHASWSSRGARSPARRRSPLYRVGTIKAIPGVRTYVAVDGGMCDNMRPMLYDSRYEAMLANRPRCRPREVVTVAGKHCESGDVLVRDVHDRAARAGRRAGHARHRRLRLRHGQQLQRPAAAGGGHGGRRPGARDHRARDVGRRAAPAASAAIDCSAPRRRPAPTGRRARRLQANEGRTAVESVGIGLVGYGTVGSGVGRLLRESADEIRLATGKEVTLRTVCELSPERQALVPPGVRVTTDFADLVERSRDRRGDRADRRHRAGAHLPARRPQGRQGGRHGQQAAPLAARRRAAADGRGRPARFLRFEASSVGAVPVIKVLRESLAAARGHRRHGHRQRHDQLHPVGHGPDRRRVRPDARRRPRSSATPRPTRPRT